MNNVLVLEDEVRSMMKCDQWGDQEVITHYGYPLYVYEESVIERQIHILEEALTDFELFYSFKANPNLHICEFMNRQGVGADTASSNEVLKAVKAGFSKENILYSSPGKTEEDIEKTIDHAIIVADSYNELILINKICSRKGIRLPIGIRINPAHSITSEDALEIMGGTPSKFGVDEESLLAHKEFIENLSHIEIIGIHVYIGSQMLNYHTVYDNIQSIFAMGEFCITQMKWNLSFIDFGGGFGVPYLPDEEPLDLRALKPMVQELVAKQKIVTKKRVRLIVESGRFLVTEAGRFLTKIVDIKVSRGKKFLIIHGGMNGFFRPVFMNLLHAVSISYGEGIKQEKEEELVSVGGHLCTPIDMVAKDILLPKAQIGDILCIRSAGSYGYTMSLREFIDHRQAKEIYIDKQGSCMITGGVGDDFR